MTGRLRFDSGRTPRSRVHRTWAFVPAQLAINVCKQLMLKGNMALILRERRAAPRTPLQKSYKEDYFLQYFHSLSRL